MIRFSFDVNEHIILVFCTSCNLMIEHLMNCVLKENLRGKYLNFQSKSLKNL